MILPVSTQWQRLAASMAVGFAVVTVAPRASANPESDAKDLFARGRDLRTANDCGSAAPLFRKAWTIYPQGLGPLRNLAECEEQLGHFASARRAWLDLKRALIVSNDPKYAGWDQDAEEAAARLKAKVATFVVDVYVKSADGELLANENTGVDIFVNGESVGTTLVGTPLERDPGNYLIRAQISGAQPVEQTVSLNAGDNPHVTIRLDRTAKPRPLPATVATTEDHGTRRTIGWVVAGVGAAALVGSGITFLVRQGALGDVDDQCPSHRGCPESLRDTYDRGKTMSTLTSILLPVGLVGLGAGLALVFTSGTSRGSKGAAAVLSVTPSTGGFALSGRF